MISGSFIVVPANALEILSFFHSQGWSYSSGGRSSSWGSRLSRGQQRVESSGSESPPPFSAGSYGVSYSGGCLPGPSFPPRPAARISTTTTKKTQGEEKKARSLMLRFCDQLLWMKNGDSRREDLWRRMQLQKHWSNTICKAWLAKNFIAFDGRGTIFQLIWLTGKKASRSQFKLLVIRLNSQSELLVEFTIFRLKVTHYIPDKTNGFIYGARSLNEEEAVIPVKP